MLALGLATTRAQALEAATEAVLVAEGQLTQAPPQLGDVWCGGHRVHDRPYSGCPKHKRSR